MGILVFEDSDLPGGGTALTAVGITLWGSGAPIKGRQISTGKIIQGTYYPPINSIGYWEAELVSNLDINPPGTTYRIRELIDCEEFISFISVPVTGGPFIASTLEVDAMNSIASPELSAHANDITLHAGHELASATIGAPGFTTSSASFVDVTGLSITFVAPPQPYRIGFSVPIIISNSGSTAEMQLIDTIDGELPVDGHRATVANDGCRLNAHCRVPNTFHAPLAGTFVTYKLQLRVTGGGSVNIIPDLFGGRNVPVVEAILQ